MTEVTEAGDGDAVTFEAFARLIGKSRPYISKLVKEGRIRPPALTPERKILPDLARQQIAEGADPARGRHGTPVIPVEADGTFASMRARKMAAEAEQAELDLKQRLGELVERSVIVEAIAPPLRKLRDDALAVPRDEIADPALAARIEEALSAVFERTSMEILTNGGNAAA